MPCEAGTYCRDGQVTVCKDYSTSEQASSTAESCKCFAGFEPLPGSGKCQVCAFGFYKIDGGNFQCAACPQNAATAGLGSFAKEQCYCLPGYVGQPGENCTSCPVGAWCSGAAALLSRLPF